MTKIKKNWYWYVLGIIALYMVIGYFMGWYPFKKKSTKGKKNISEAIAAINADSAWKALVEAKATDGKSAAWHVWTDAKYILEEQGYEVVLDVSQPA